jgi:hypothetical protein
MQVSKRQILFLVSFLLIYGCKSETGKKNDLKEHNLFGKVKSVKQYPAISKINGSVFYMFYNPSGKLNKTFQSDKDFISTITFEYNKDGKKTAENINTIFQGHPSPHKFTYEYNDKGNLILVKVYRCNPHLEIEHTTEHIYNSSDIQTEEIEYNDKNIKNNIKKLKYDDSGNLIEQKWYDSKGLNSIITIKYDKNGNITTRKVIHTDATKESSVTYNFKYDKYNNEIYEEVLSADKSTFHTYLYEYDNQGNWVKRIEIDDNNSKKITERVIEYY